MQPIKGLEKQRWFIWTIVLLIVVGVSLTVYIYYYGETTQWNVPLIVWLDNKNPKIDNSEVAMKSYSDPDKYFSIDIPATWKSSLTGLASIDGHKAEGINLSSDGSTFYDSQGAVVYVNVEEGQPTCSEVAMSQNKPNTTVGGLPATYRVDPGDWMLFTNSATFTISYIFPGANVVDSGGLMIPANAPKPKPVSQDEIDAYQQMVNKIVNTFRPTNPKLLSC
jgi:hypothetical protein